MTESLRFGEDDNADGTFTLDDIYGIRNLMQRVLARHDAQICCEDQHS